MLRPLLPLLILMLAGCDRAGARSIGIVVSGDPSEAAVLALQDLEADGAAGVTLVVKRPDEPAAATAALRLAQDLAVEPSVLAVVGHSNSPASLAASQVYNRAGVLQLAPTTTASVYSHAGPYSFRMVPGDDRQAAFLVESIRATVPAAARLALVYVNDDYGRNFYRELRPLLDSVSFEGVYSETSGPAYLPALAGQLAAAAPHVLVWIGRPPQLGALLPQLRRSLPDLVVICGDSCDDASVYANEDGTYTGVRFVRFTDPTDPRAEVVEFRARYRAATGNLAASEAVLTYDATRLIGTAISAGARSREDVRRYMESLGRERPPYPGLGGPVAFDSAGNLLREYGLAVVTPAGVRGVGASH